MADEDPILVDGKILNDLRVVDLKRELDTRRLSKSGSKQQLIARLKAQLQLEKLQSVPVDPENKVPNSELENDEVAGQSTFIKKYLARQQKALDMQFEAKKKIEEERRRSTDEGESETEEQQIAVKISPDENDPEMALVKEVTSVHGSISHIERAPVTTEEEMARRRKQKQENVAPEKAEVEPLKRSKDVNIKDEEEIPAKKSRDEEKESRSPSPSSQRSSRSRRKLAEEHVTRQRLKESAEDNAVSEKEDNKKRSRSKREEKVECEQETKSKDEMDTIPAKSVIGKTESLHKQLTDLQPQKEIEVCEGSVDNVKPKRSRWNKKPSEEINTKINIEESVKQDGDETAKAEEKKSRKISRVEDIKPSNQDVINDKPEQADSDKDKHKAKLDISKQASNDSLESNVTQDKSAKEIEISQKPVKSPEMEPSRLPSKEPVESNQGDDINKRSSKESDEKTTPLSRDKTDAMYKNETEEESGERSPSLPVKKAVQSSKDLSASVGSNKTQIPESPAKEAQNHEEKGDVDNQSIVQEKIHSPMRGVERDTEETVKIDKGFSRSSTRSRSRSKSSRNRSNSSSSRSSSSVSSSSSDSSDLDTLVKKKTSTVLSAKKTKPQKSPSNSPASRGHSPSPERSLLPSKLTVKSSTEANSPPPQSSPDKQPIEQKTCSKQKLVKLDTEKVKTEPLSENSQEEMEIVKISSNKIKREINTEGLISEPKQVESKSKDNYVPKLLRRRSLRSTDGDVKMEEGDGDAGEAKDEKKEKPAKKRKWGSSSNKSNKKTSSLEISTESLKGLMSDVKPVLLTSEPILDLGGDNDVLSDREEDRRDVKIRRTVVQVTPTDRTVEEKDQIEEKEIQEDSDEGEIKETKLPKETKIIRRLNHQVIQEPEEPTAARRTPSPPRNPITSIVHIFNLVRPFTLGQLKELLKRSGEMEEAGFWINNIKSHCIAVYKASESAEEARKTLHGTRWPPSNPKVLRVDFSTREEFEQYKDSNETTDILRTKPVPVQKEKDRKERDRESRDTRKKEERPIREWDRDKIRSQSRERPREKGRERRHRSRSADKEKECEKRKKSKDMKEKKEKKSDEEPPAKLLDDLFKKTKSTPCIYWLPLTEEQSIVRLASRKARIADREKRRNDTEKDGEVERKQQQRVDCVPTIDNRRKDKDRAPPVQSVRARDRPKRSQSPHDRGKPRRNSPHPTKPEHRHSRSRSRGKR